MRPRPTDPARLGRTTRLPVLAAATAGAGLLAVLAPATAAVPAPPPVVTTLGVGDCTPGSAGCGQALLYPSGGDVDPAGNIYTADTGNDQIEAFSAAGQQLWRVGTRGPLPKSPGHFQNPRDLAYLDAPGYQGLDGAGLLFVADEGNNRVQVLNAADGSVDTSLSAGWTYRFSSVIGITAGVSATGTPVILTANDIDGNVKVFSPAGSLLQTVGVKCTKAGSCAPNQLNGPRDAATDAAGDIYVADYANDRIVEFNPSGSAVLRSWGSRGTGQYNFNRPYGVALDAAGHLYVADSDNGRIQEFDTTVAPPATPPYLATFGSQVAGGTPAEGQFFALRRVAVGPGPNPAVYGFDLWGNAVQRFTAAGSPNLMISTGGPAAGGFNEAYGVTTDGAGNVYVADTDNQRMQVFASSGGLEATWGQRGFGESNLGFNWPRDIAYAPASGTLWVADTKNERVTQFNPDGTATGVVLGGVLGSAVGDLHWPYGVAADGADVVVADTFNNRVQLWDPASRSVLWSTDSLGIALKNPKAVAVAPDPSTPGRTDVYVADSVDQRLVVLDAATGALLASYAPVTSTGAKVLHQIEGVAVDPRNGNIWVADTSFNRLVELSPTGALIRTVGKAGSAAGQFDDPTHLAIAVTGSTATLWVADSWNDRVQAFDITSF